MTNVQIIVNNEGICEWHNLFNCSQNKYHTMQCKFVTYEIITSLGGLLEHFVLD